MQSANKMCVALLFGGMSSEHEVSCVSVGNFVRNIDRSKYEVLTVGITKEGRWLYTEATAEQMADGSWEELPGNMPCVISPDRADYTISRVVLTYCRISSLSVFLARRTFPIVTWGLRDPRIV